MKRKFLYLPLFLILLFVAGWSFWPKKKHVTFNDAVQSIIAKKTLLVLPEPAKPKDLKIISAQYGAKDQWLNVTEHLQKKIHSHPISP